MSPLPEQGGLGKNLSSMREAVGEPGIGLRNLIPTSAGEVSVVPVNRGVQLILRLVRAEEADRIIDEVLNPAPPRASEIIDLTEVEISIGAEVPTGLSST